MTRCRPTRVPGAAHDEEARDAKRHLGLADRAEQLREDVDPMSRQLAKTAEDLGPILGPGTPILNRRRVERHRGPVHGQAERDDPISQRQERSVEVREEAGGRVPRLRMLGDPPRAEEEAVRGVGEPIVKNLGRARRGQPPIVREEQQQDAVVRARRRGFSHGPTLSARAICSRIWMIRSSLAPTHAVSHQTR